MKYVEVSTEVGASRDACPEVNVRLYGKGTFVVETGSCIL